MKPSQIDKDKIQAELQELAGTKKVKVKLNRSSPYGYSSRETDGTFTLTLNPSRIRTPRKLESYIAQARRDVCWGDGA